MTRLWTDHFRRYIPGRFWVMVLAAAGNGIYWRLPSQTLGHDFLVGATMALAATSAVFHVRALGRKSSSARKTGRRIDWLALLASLLILALVATELSGLRRRWGLT